jgi:tartrate dehydrogenase/decarboxylase/D-malate dehydrogenase
MKTYRIATIPGDGIGKEVIPAGREVLEALARADGSLEVRVRGFRLGRRLVPRARRDDAGRRPRGTEGQGRDPVRLGGRPAHPRPHHAVGPAPEDLPGLRPVRERASDPDPAGHRRPPEALHPEQLDWVIVRENSEGEYSGAGGRVHQGHPIEAATDVTIMTRAGVERIIRYAFRLAQSRPRKLLTVVSKSNAQRHAMVMWDEIAVQVAAEFPDVKWDKELVDAATARMVNRPATLDTIVATNLHADILSDLAAALAGSLGIAPTGNIDPERRYPSMFEPIHGSAFDIMGKGLANPVGTFWSAVMMLEHFGEHAAAKRLMRAVEQVTAQPSLHTRDLGGRATTAEVTAAVCAAVSAPT